MIGLTLVLAAGLAACSSTISGPTSTPASPTTAPTTAPPLPLCADLAWFTAPEAMYADRPLYVGNEMPIEAVMGYASTMDGYVEAWIDREHNGWVNVGFNGVDIAAAQAELSEVFPDEGVVAVELPRTHAELEDIRQRVAAALPDEFDTVNSHVLHGRVEVWVGALTDDRVATVQELVGDEPVCVDGTDPSVTPQDGPQAEGGENWRLLGVFDTSIVERPVVIGDPATLETLWAGLGGGAPPPVDFGPSIVVAVEIGHSGSCPVTRLDDVAVLDDQVELNVVTVTDDYGCTDDYHPRTYVVSIDRAALPEPPWRFGQAGAPGRMTEVTDDLRVEGAVPTGARPAEPRPRAALPDVIEVGFPFPATLDTSCGLSVIGPVNWVVWQAGFEGIPAEWEALVENGLLDVSLFMTPGPEPTLTVSAGGHDVLYLPGDDAPVPGC